jgi:uncharacterized protein (DUF2141 family)
MKAMTKSNRPGPLLVLMMAMVSPFARPAIAQTAASPQRSSPADTAPAKNEPAKIKSTITVRIEGLRNDLGTVFVSLHDKKESFKDNKNPVASGQARPGNRSCVVVFENVVPGRYALTFIHDEIDNKKIDKSFIGIPKEGFGFSRDAMGRFGPPSFDDADLAIPAGSSQVVMHAKYK